MLSQLYFQLSFSFTGLIVIFLNIYLVFSKIAKKVPIQSNQPLSCHYKDFFYSYFYCDNFGEKSRIDGDSHPNITEQCIPFHQKVNRTSPAIFVLYDVNSVEGFNLRRDVYIRMAVFLKSLRGQKSYENAYLVLPPFYQLYHWNLASSNRYRGNDDILFWNHFFDLASMRRYTNVIDLWEYFEIMRDCFGMKSEVVINHVFKLRHFESMFQSGKFEEKFEVQSNCNRDSSRSRGQVLSLYSNFSVAKIHCVEFQGSAGLLFDLIKKYPKR